MPFLKTRLATVAGIFQTADKLWEVSLSCAGGTEQNISPLGKRPPTIVHARKAGTNTLYTLL